MIVDAYRAAGLLSTGRWRKSMDLPGDRVMMGSLLSRRPRVIAATELLYVDAEENHGLDRAL
jgi:hypothetical protein